MDSLQDYITIDGFKRPVIHHEDGTSTIVIKNLPDELKSETNEENNDERSPTS